jgi:hypothetical protein
MKRKMIRLVISLSLFMAFCCGCASIHTTLPVSSPEIIGSCTPILHKPGSGLSTRIPSLSIPEEISSLSDITQGGMFFDFGFDACLGDEEHRRQHQVLTLDKVLKRKRSVSLGIRYQFFLSCEEVVARDWFSYSVSSDPIRDYFPAFIMGRSDAIDYMITYINQERSRSGSCSPLPLYIQRAQFRFRNMSVDIEVMDDHLDSTFMAEAIEYLAQVLTSKRIAIKQEPEADGARPADPPVRSVVGKWRGSSEGEVLEFILEADGRADVTGNGSSFRKELMPIRGDIIYTADLSTNPMHLDVVAIDAAGKEIRRMKMIFEFINKNTIKLRTLFNNDRPDGFRAGYADTIVLEKVD